MTISKRSIIKDPLYIPKELKKGRFNPSKSFLKNAVDGFIKQGGKIIKIEPPLEKKEKRFQNKTNNRSGRAYTPSDL